jgi:hypothetical protein
MLVIYLFIFDKRTHCLYVSQSLLNQSLHHTLDYGRPTAGSSEPQPLRHLLAKVHQEIITCWHFMNEKNVRYLWGVMGHTLKRIPVRSSAAKSSRDSFSSWCKTLKDRGIKINLTARRMCLYNGIE